MSRTIVSDNSDNRQVQTPAKPQKPYPAFPLTPHPTGRWCKKIRGTLYYFGKVDDPQAALEEYERQKDALHAGRKPREKAGDGHTVADMVNQFLANKQDLVDVGELTQRSHSDYEATGKRMAAEFNRNRLLTDIGTDDFARLRKSLAKKWGPTTLANEIQRVRVFFNFAFKEGMIEQPMRYGAGFDRPSKKTLRKARAEKEEQIFEAAEIRKMLDAAGPQMKAMILLGINAGFGNADCGTLRQEDVDLETGLIDYVRHKTGISRRCVLWPETAQAIREAVAVRPTPKDAADADLVFVTNRGYSWFKDSQSNPLSAEMRKLLASIGVNHGRGFYCLRHTFRNVADDVPDTTAINLIMGHESGHVSEHYKERGRVKVERLRVVANHVHSWLFPARK